jgi:signal peptidase I
MAKSDKRDSTPQPKAPAAAPAPDLGPRLSPAAVMLRWFFSKTVRQATAMAKHVRKLLNHQRDILSPQAVQAVDAAIRDLQNTVASRADQATLEKQMENLETVANKWLKPYPFAAWRENVEVLLVALTVAMGIRTFFLQPFKIPTGSMQPTLYGVTSSNLLTEPKAKIPTGWERIREWFEGISYIHIVADNEGKVDGITPPVRFLIFNIKQTLFLGGKPYTIWFPPDYGSSTLDQRAELPYDKVYHPGEDVIKLKVHAGDHLFVDRVSYNFIPPHRGDIVVFETKGIPEERRTGPGWNIPPDQFYIKRLVGLPGERVQIGNDRHLIIDGKRLDSSTPHFQNIYSFNPKEPTRDSIYSGHDGRIAPYFGDHQEGVAVPKDGYLVMGDNTASSLDSRFWGPLSTQSVIGKAFFVYWPLTERFGWGYHR